jgi:hypothetical protein
MAPLPFSFKSDSGYSALWTAVKIAFGGAKWNLFLKFFV